MNSQLIEKIHAADGLFSLAVTGGGTSAIADLFAVAGASGTVIEATVPYHANALQAYLGASSPQACTTATARAMAMTAYLRACAAATDAPTSLPVFGLGCTAAIATNRDRRGTDRCHIALQSADITRTVDLALDKSLSRDEQEAFCKAAIITAMAEAQNIECEPLQSDLLEIESMATIAPTEWRALLDGSLARTTAAENETIFPGAFNPFHQGHARMKQVAEEILGGEVTLEISIHNVDKPPLDFMTMQERQTGVGNHALVFTNAPTFIEKSALFPGATFVVGVDTLTRIADSRYYADQAACNTAINDMASRGNRFLVFGRTVNGNFQALKDTAVPDNLRALCTEVDEARFREDISSTEIRAAY